MAEKKTNILETVMEEIGSKQRVNSPGKYGKTYQKSGGNAVYRNIKGQKSVKGTRTKRVIVTLPTVNRRQDDENKVFPKGIESMRRQLEEIKEEARENKTDGDETRNHELTENKENSDTIIENGIKRDSVVIINENDKDTNKALSDQIYGMFTRTNTERSLLSQTSDSIILSSVTKRNKNKDFLIRPKSTGRWSKKDLDLFLPRKSFFSVHDNTMSAAGFDVRTDEERKRPEWRNILKMHTEEELRPPVKEEEAIAPIVPGMLGDESEEEAFGLENVETAVSAGGKDSASTVRGKKKQSSKKTVSTEKEEYKPLYDYLKYIHDNPEEYIHQAKFTRKNIDHKHPSQLVRLGRAFRRGHHGAVRNNIYLHALTWLKPKHSETSTQRPTRNEKTGMKKEGDGTEANTATQDETEIEKLKSKAERWMKNLTTQQYLKAKELALKDVGEEDMNTTKWWLAFRSCKYLRLPPYITDTSQS